MAFVLEDKWVWDFWFCHDGDDLHLFYLQAPRSLVDEERRHRNATIGHARTRDLVNWEILPDPIGKGAPGAFDDLATWTGSVFRHGDLWYLFYTGVSTVDDGYVQRINYATSTDLIHFTRSGRPPFVTDTTWYEVLEGSTEIEESWRDPWVYEDADQPGLFHMLLTARIKNGPGHGRGVVAHATSTNLHDWVAGPPITEPGQVVGLEVPSTHFMGGQWRLLFCTQERWISDARKTRTDVSFETGTYYYSGPTPLGPFTEDSSSLLLGEPYYAGRALQWQGQWYLMAFIGVQSDGTFLGGLSDPMPIEANDDGTLHVRVPAQA